VQSEIEQAEVHQWLHAQQQIYCEILQSTQIPANNHCTYKCKTRNNVIFISINNVTCMP